MAKPKSKDIGTLPPAIFDLKTVSTPVSYQSEAGIDTQGYDPAWDDPEFCKTKSDSDRRGEDERVDRPKPNSESKLEFLPESDGQLTIATREPSNPEDYPTPEAYERARATWEANREAAPVAAEVVEPESTAIDGELSYEERQDRLHLERKVERAFYEAGRALRELRDRRLYRSTHKTFENYCRDRFGFKRRHPYQLINAATVVDNLIDCANELSSETMCANRAQNEAMLEKVSGRANENPDDKMCANRAQNPDGEMCADGSQILPTSEYQVRPLTKLEPKQQWEAWQEAVEEADGKVPPARVVKDVVDRFVRDSLPEATRAHHLSLEPGGLVEVSCSSNQKIHARLGRIAAVKEKTVDVWLRDVETMTMNKHTLKHHQVEAVPLERAPGLRELCDRFSALRERGLDPFELEVLALLDRAVVLTPVEMGYLEGIEGRS